MNNYKDFGPRRLPKMRYDERIKEWSSSTLIRTGQSEQLLLDDPIQSAIEQVPLEGETPTITSTNPQVEEPPSAVHEDRTQTHERKTQPHVTTRSSGRQRRGTKPRVGLSESVWKAFSGRKWSKGGRLGCIVVRVLFIGRRRWRARPCGRFLFFGRFLLLRLFYR